MLHFANMARKNTQKESLIAFGFAVFLVLVIDLLTNEIGSGAKHADFRNYMELFNEGFGSTNLQAPYAYRYLYAFMAKGLSAIVGGNAFLWLARIALASFLFSLFLIIKELKGTLLHALVAMVIIGFSFCNVKFLLFDPTRPDALGFLFVALAYLAHLRKNFWWLVILTIIGLQIREFVIIPFLVNAFSRNIKGRLWPKEITGWAIVIAAVLLPRMLIDTTADLQFVTFDASAPGKFLNRVLLNWKRHINVLFVLLAYYLPLLMFWAGGARMSFGGRKREVILFAAIVLLLTLLGGTDLARFMAYSFIPLMVIFSVEDFNPSWLLTLLVIVSVFYFNRIWLSIPFEDKEAYLDFYGGVSDRVNEKTAYRFFEAILFVGLALVSRILLKKNPARGRG